MKLSVELMAAIVAEVAGERSSCSHTVGGGSPVRKRVEVRGSSGVVGQGIPGVSPIG